MKKRSQAAPTRTHKKPGLYVLVVTASVCLLVFLFWKRGGAKEAGAESRSDQPGVHVDFAAADNGTVRILVREEETSLALAPKMKALSESIMDLRLPGPRASSVFAAKVAVTDLGPLPEATLAGTDLIEAQPWPVSKETKEAAEVNLWRPLLDAVSYFEHAKLFIASGTHPGENPLEYEGRGRFSALARMKTGEWRALEGAMDLVWERPESSAGVAGEWRMTGWKTKEMNWSAVRRPFFREVLESAMRGTDEAKKLRRSQHYETTVKYYQGGMQKQPHPYFAPISANQKEGVSVGDITGDGWDDIYITVRLGKNLLLVNQRDGTFVEAAAQHKLDLPGHTTCSLIADFDNDGDADVLLGRSLLKSSFLENRNGVYYQPPIPAYMPMAAISMAAADYNMDGLLDVYICTYRPAAPMGASPAGGVSQGGDFDWPDEFLNRDQAREFRQRLAENQQRKGGTVLDQVGPPNVLLVNRGGGRFEPAPENNVLGLWRNTLQATWGDYDQDGDPDLFVANDWAMSALYRNDGPAGFTDVSEETGVTYYGFSMGASFGDYDNNGLEDVYVSNMYSDAGRRMTTRIDGISKMFIESASGNWLYRHDSKGKFTQVSGMESPAMQVINAGWSWGGAFVDFDNDRFLDLYVLSGYFTAPEEVSSELDLESNLWRTMVRTDENLARTSFRFSPEWKRTGPPDNLGPEIDARLAGSERQGEKVEVHSLQGYERNHYFANRGGRAFTDISALSGLDNIGDSRGFAVLDYDRDGWQDVALVNANQPLFNLYHNDFAAAGRSGGIVALRFVGGNKAATPSKEFACRDGYGARVTVDLGTEKLIREHRCGDGWAAQNSATMIVGIGQHGTVPQLSVRWPSGKTTVTKDIPEGTLLTIYENPADGPDGQAVSRETYRAKVTLPKFTSAAGATFPIASLDKKIRDTTRLRIFTSFATSSDSMIAQLPLYRLLKDEVGDEGVELIAVPVDESDDNSKLGAFAREHRPPARLLNLPPEARKGASEAFAAALGKESPLPGTVVTDGTGHIFWAQQKFPSISEVRKLLDSLK